MKPKKTTKKATKKKPVKGTKAVKTNKQTKSAIKQKKVKRFKLAPGPLNEAQIKMFIEHYNEHGFFPGSKIPCNITGKLTTCVGPWLKKKIAEYGSAENLLRKYRCRGAVKKTKQIIKGVNPKKKKLKAEKKDGEYVVPPMKITVRREITNKEKTEMSKTICMRPDIFLNNGRHCDGCMHFDICVNGIKCKSDPKNKKQVTPVRLRMFTSRKIS